MFFPSFRGRRLRRTAAMRRMTAETRLGVDDLIMPYFVVPGYGIRDEISSMPGCHRHSVDELVQAARKTFELGIPAILLFGIPESKDEEGSAAWDEDGIVPTALRALKKELPELVLITDVCLCEYTSHGHCGVLHEGRVQNDPTLALLARTALAHARAGSDMIAPSDMMDGRVAAIREALDDGGYSEIPIMSYAAKYCSAFYGPFRDAADSAPQSGDRRGYQMAPPNGREALREVAQDLHEGADWVMVKPALAYLDVVARVRQEFDSPIAAYNVSGEFAMIKAAARAGWIDEKRVVWEMLTSMRRAGADVIISYFANDVARWIREGSAPSF